MNTRVVSVRIQLAFSMRSLIFTIMCLSILIASCHCHCNFTCFWYFVLLECYGNIYVWLHYNLNGYASEKLQSLIVYSFSINLQNFKILWYFTLSSVYFDTLPARSDSNISLSLSINIIFILIMINLRIMVVCVHS